MQTIYFLKARFWFLLVRWSVGKRLTFALALRASLTFFPLVPYVLGAHAVDLWQDYVDKFATY